MEKNKFDELSTTELEQLLRNDCDGVHTLTEADIITICQILARRHPYTATSAETAWRQFLRHYAPSQNDCK